MNNTTRVRFAPSPTGYLHVGGARTALFNFLFARSQKGVFLLRIEDTDPERSQPAFIEDIQESLRWLNISWDEPVIFQSHRTSRYQTIAEGLKKDGKAYYCECSKEFLDEMRKEAQKKNIAFTYPGICRDKNISGSHLPLRLKLPKEGNISYTDLLRGPITIQNKVLDDFVIQRGDGSFVYNFCVVIDDHDQSITHVLRGDDHINNTPKQIILYQTLNWPIPCFGHFGMILGKDKAKLSKRHGALSTLEYRTMGFLPEALNSFLARLGWSHKDQEVFTMEELITFFSLEHVGASPSVFDIDKLEWMNGRFLEKKDPHELFIYIHKYFAQFLHFISPAPSEIECKKGIGCIQSKVKTVVELIDQLNTLFGEDPALKPPDLSKDREQKEKILRTILSEFHTISSFAIESKPHLEHIIEHTANIFEVKKPMILSTIRWAIAGEKPSPQFYPMLECMGKDRTLRRIEKACNLLTALS